MGSGYSKIEIEKRRTWLKAHESTWRHFPNMHDWGRDGTQHPDPHRDPELLAVLNKMVDAGLYSRKTSDVDAAIGILKHISAIRESRK